MAQPPHRGGKRGIVPGFLGGWNYPQATGTAPNTVLAWLIEVADHATAFSRYFLHDVRVTQVQLDELFALLSAVKAGEVSEAEAIQRLSRSPQWVWTAIDPVTKLLLTINVG